MNKIIIRAIGRTTEPWYQQAIHSYQKRLEILTPIQIVELPEGHRGSSKPDLEKTRVAEAQSLLKGIPKEAFVVALDETGKSFSSESFARSLSDWSTNGRLMVFLIGGSWGLDGEVKARSNQALSLSQMTLPHSLARLVLVEQLYRAAMIQGGRTYHK